MQFNAKPGYIQYPGGQKPIHSLGICDQEILEDYWSAVMI